MKTKSITPFLTSLFFLFFEPQSFSQEGKTDTLKTLDEVTVKAFEQNRALQSSSYVRVIETNNGDRYQKTSLVNSFNSVSGVRMEERSPGSYRINIRGSSLRSPFGVRNVKVYWNDIPITDAGGNTYFNQFAYNNFSYLEIYKGPAGSLYGAGTGGLVLLHNLERWRPGTSFDYVTGSYGTHNIFASVRFGKMENQNQMTYAHNQSDGYRVQTKMRRDNFSWISRLKISDKQEITASLLFTDMYYQTPGALTLAEYNTHPRQARPAGGGFPGAVNAKAAIYQKNVLAGFTSTYHFDSSFRNTTTLFGVFNQVKNPAIRNYERRNEPGFGGRTLFNWTKNYFTSGILQLTAGSEFQQGYFNTRVSKNLDGNPDTVQTNDDIVNKLSSFFLQGTYSVDDTWYATVGISLNKYNVGFTRLSLYPVNPQVRSYRNEIAPRLYLKRKWNDFSLAATVSRGFSPPTIAELLPSTGVISTDLEAESGWNYELAANTELFKRLLRITVTGYYFRLNNALVQRRDLSGADYFVNAGDTRQKGIEIETGLFKILRGRIFDYLVMRWATAFTHYRYGNFVKGADDFSGKRLPSVPCITLSALGDLHLMPGFYLNTTYYHASRIYLNDANTAFADGYHLLGLRLGWKKTLHTKYKLDFHLGVENLFDEKYSLGNDINAAANRFYNAAPGRNYYLGISFQWTKPRENR